MPLTYPIHTARLPNGLRVVVSPDRSIPVVTVNLWVNIGSRHEQPGQTGLAHLFEHLMFQGSRHVGAGEHMRLLMAEGGRSNASTWFDRTNYFETVPTGALDLALWLEADRFKWLLDRVSQANLDNQRDVVKEEKRQRYDNVPYGHALADVFRQTFPADHPYAHPTIGSMEDLDAATLDAVHDFFHDHYGPVDTVLAIVGDVDANQALGRVAHYFGDWQQPTQPQRPLRRPLAALTSPVAYDVRGPVPNDRLYFAFRAPAEGTPEFHGVALAMDAIAGLASSRLGKKLVRGEEVLTGLSATTLGLVEGSSLALIVADVDEDADPQRVEDLIVAELGAFAEQGPTDAEIEAAFADTERGWLSSLASQEERADLIAQYTLLHQDPQYINTWFDRLTATSPEAIHREARAWLRPDSRVTVRYLREDS